MKGRLYHLKSADIACGTTKVHHHAALMEVAIREFRHCRVGIPPVIVWVTTDIDSWLMSCRFPLGGKPILRG